MEVRCGLNNDIDSPDERFEARIIAAEMTKNLNRQTRWIKNDVLNSRSYGFHRKNFLPISG
jgi:hypothetical protein